MMTQRQKTKIYDASYKRLGKEKDSGSDSGEETELFIRSKPQRIEIPTVEIVVEDGDTLQSLAIRHHCKIGDLKRINNIHKENEIFAKRTIKVPYRPFTMALAGVHKSGTTSPDISEQPSTSNLIDIESVSSKLTDNSIDALNSNNNNVNEIIFNSQIQQIPCDRLTEDVLVHDSEEVHLLPQRDKELPGKKAISRFSCNGADGDISWVTLIVCIVIFIVAVPLILVYVAENEHHVS